jgi:hypothetical protein
VRQRRLYFLRSENFSRRPGRFTAAHQSAGKITMTWFWRKTGEANRDLLRTEERLSIIAQLQVDLNQHSQQIKQLTSTIVQALATDVNLIMLTKIAPLLAAIPPLLREVTPTPKTVEAEFATLYEGQQRIQADISRVVSMITDLATHLRDKA